MMPSWLGFHNWVKVLLAFCGVVLALAIFLAVSLGLFDFPPKDAKMIRTFTVHQATFNRLVAMSDADARSKRFAPTFYPDSLLLPPVRLQAYRAAFDTLQLAEGLDRLRSGDTVTVTFTAWGEGWAGMAPNWYLFYDDR